MVWMFVEALGKWRHVVVTDRRTAVDWAHQMRALVDHPRFAETEKITVVLDNLNTHDIGSFYEAFAPQEARRLMAKLELIFTPKHGSWLNVAEPELSVMTRQSLGERPISQSWWQSKSPPGLHNATKSKSALTGNSPPIMHATNSGDSTRKLRRD